MIQARANPVIDRYLGTLSGILSPDRVQRKSKFLGSLLEFIHTVSTAKDQSLDESEFAAKVDFSKLRRLEDGAGRVLAILPLEKHHLQLFADWLETGGASPVVIHDTVNTVKQFYDSLVSTHVVPRNPAIGLDLPKVPDPSPTRRLTAEEANRLLDAAATGKHPLRDFVIVVVSIGCGPRGRELLRMKGSDLTDMGMVVPEAKTGPRVVPLLPELQEIIRGCARLFPDPDAPIISDAQGRPISLHSLNTILRKLAARAGVAPFTSHTLRRTCATLFVQCGASIVDVQALLGHKQITTTIRYVGLPEKALDCLRSNVLIDSVSSRFATEIARNRRPDPSLWLECRR